jgi:hypothetical protein
MQTVVAQAGTQSNVRLAHVDDGAAFSPELVRGSQRCQAPNLRCKGAWYRFS